MKYFLILLVSIITVSGAFSQAPNQFKYQAVLRDASGNIIASQPKTIVIDILQGSQTGASVFTETHNVTTSTQGLINITIGSVKADVLQQISWGTNSYFIRITVDGVEMGTSQLLSVPYSLYSKEAQTVNYNNVTNKPTIDGSETKIEAGTNITIEGFGTISKPYIVNAQNTNTKGQNVGDLQFWNGESWDIVPAGKPGQYLRFSPLNKPEWSGNSYPIVATSSSIESITANSATIGGQIINDGNSPIIDEGVWVSQSAAPSINDSKYIYSQNTSSFKVKITGLSFNTTYYVRAYATNNVGTSFGEQYTFTTSDISVPSVVTFQVTKFNITTATVSALYSGDQITCKGLCWSKNQNPTISDSRLDVVDGDISFLGDITGLAGGTTYYVRAFATNSKGTSYGSQLTFKTLPPLHIGDSYAGGLIFYIDKTGEHGLACKPFNEGPALGSIWSTAISLCNNLTYNGVTGWYLPSLNELTSLYNNLGKQGLGSLGVGTYWSSNSIDSNSAYLFSFNSGLQMKSPKSVSLMVRPIRAF